MAAQEGVQSSAGAADFRRNLIDSDEGVAELLARTHRIAVLGIKTEAQANQAAFYVPEYLASRGLDIVPIPVYFPDVTQILGRPVYRRLVDVPGEVDLVDVFRRPRDIDAHVQDIIAKRPKAVWFQLGIRNDDAAERLARTGIQVVQDRCLMVDYRRLGR